MNPVAAVRLAWAGLGLAGLWLVGGIAKDTKDGVKEFNRGFATNALVFGGLALGLYLLTRKSKA